MPVFALLDMQPLPVALHWPYNVQNVATLVPIFAPFVDHRPGNSKGHVTPDYHRVAVDFAPSMNAIQ